MSPMLKLFIAAALARTYPRVAWLFRSRSWMIQETILPVLGVAASAFAYRAMLRATPEGDVAFREYTGLVVLGAAMTTFWMNVLWGMGAQLYWERDSGNLEIYVMSPAPMMGILAGMAMGGMTTTIVRAAAITISGVLLFDVPIAPSSWWMLGVAFLLTLSALYGLGMTFASVFLLWGREAWHVVNLLQEPIYLLSGTNFPLGPILARLKMTALAGMVSLIPLAAGMDAMRQILFHTPGLLPLWQELTVLAVLTLVCFYTAGKSLRYLERRAREDGKLTIRWQ